MININRKLLFIDICKTAGTSIIQSLKAKFPNEQWIGKHHNVKNWLISPNFKNQPKVTTEILEMYNTFTVIRNPYDRIVSLWIWGINSEYRGMSFLQFLRNIESNKLPKIYSYRYAPQTDWIDYDVNTQTSKVKTIIRYENLQKELDTYFNKIGIGSIKLVKINTSSEKFTQYKHRNGMEFEYKKLHYKDYYCTASKEIVEQLYGSEIRAFGYYL